MSHLNLAYGTLFSGLGSQHGMSLNGSLTALMVPVLSSVTKRCPFINTIFVLLGKYVPILMSGFWVLKSCCEVTGALSSYMQVTAGHRVFYLCLFRGFCGQSDYSLTAMGM